MLILPRSVRFQIQIYLKGLADVCLHFLKNQILKKSLTYLIDRLSEFVIVCSKYRTSLTSADMFITAMSDAKIMPATDSQMSTTVQTTEVEFAKCDCCGLTEECTPAYIERIRERYHGKWICGLCGEAVKDEIMRSERLISTEEAMSRHMNFCRKSTSSDPPPNPAVNLITAMRQILRRSLDSPRSVRSAPTSPLRNAGGSVRLSRSSSCITDLAVEASSYTELQENGNL